MLLLYRGEAFDSNFFYHSGLDIDHSFLLSGRKQILFVPRLNESIAKKNFKGKVIVYTTPFLELSKYIKGKTVLTDFSTLNLKFANRLRKMCKIKDYSKQLLEKRAIKKKIEVSHIKNAAKITREIFDSLDLSKSKTEIDIEKQIRVETAKRGLEQAFDPIVATASSTSYPHYKATKKKLSSILLIDYGIKYKHYCSDLTRCFILDGDKKKKNEYETLQNISHSIIDELSNMRTGKEVAEFSEKLIKKAQFPKPPHAIGHGVGLDIHEYPRLNKKWKDRIAGTVMAIEPAFYLKKYGMRFEETVHFNGKKARVL